MKNNHGDREHAFRRLEHFSFFFRPKFENLLQNLLPRIINSSVHHPAEAAAAAADSVITTFGLGVEVELADARQGS